MGDGWGEDSGLLSWADRFAWHNLSETALEDVPFKINHQSKMDDPPLHFAYQAAEGAKLAAVGGLSTDRAVFLWQDGLPFHRE